VPTTPSSTPPKAYSRSYSLHSLLGMTTWNRPLREHLVLGYWRELHASLNLPREHPYSGSVHLEGDAVVVSLLV
jgi:hypothetical protein